MPNCLKTYLFRIFCFFLNEKKFLTVCLFLMNTPGSHVPEPVSRFSATFHAIYKNIKERINQRNNMKNTFILIPWFIAHQNT